MDVDLKKISLVDALKLRLALDQRLHEMRTELDEYWGKIFHKGAAGGARGSSLKGVKVPPKYRSADGETWAGRGAKPKWLTAAIKKGKKLESFRIAK